jgi:serine/threonine-protein kinase
MSIKLDNGLLLYDRYTIKHIIKETKFYKVYLVEDRVESSENCLLREFIPRNVGDLFVVRSQYEMYLQQLQRLKHPQIEEFKNVVWEQGKLYIFQSYFEKKNDRDHSPSLLTEGEAIDLLRKILPVLSYLHNQQIIHRDISPSHLLLRSLLNEPILTDFGVIREIRSQMLIETIETRLLDELREIPVVIAEGADEDLYCLAVTVLMLITGKNIKDLWKLETQTWDWEDYKILSDRFTEIITQMLAREPRNRFATAEAILTALNYHLVSPPINPTPVIPTEPTLGFPQPPPNYFPALPSSNTPSSGLKDWEKAAISGGVVGMLLLGGIAIAVRQNWLPFLQSSTPSPSIATPSVSPPASFSEPSVSPSVMSISQSEAINLVQRWLEAKKVMFAPPYNREIADEITTGVMYEKTAGFDGSINWLQNNNAYYRYGLIRIDGVDRFVERGDRAEIQLRITEDRTLVKNGRVDPEQTDFKTRPVIYYLELVNGTWKIADNQIIK